MFNHNRTIICFSHLNWDYKLFQRPQQLMLRLSRHFNVLYINYHSFWHFIRDLISEKKIYNLIVNDNLIVYSPFALPTFKKRFSSIIQLNKRLLPFFVKRRAEKLKIEKPILWLYHPRYVNVIGKFNEALVIYDCMDDFTSLLSHYEDRDENARNESELLKRTDIVFGGGYTMVEIKRHLRNDVHVFPSAVEIDHFKKALLSNTSIPDDIKDIKSPVLGYWGAIDERIDHKLLKGLAERRPDWSIVLLGPICGFTPDELPYLKNMKNVFWLGPKEYAMLANYAKKFDVCLNPFVLTSEGKHLSPTKTLEYLACGKPVVSTPIPDVVRFFNGMVVVANGLEKFEMAIERCIKGDDELKRQKRVAFTEGKTWDNTVEKMKEIILNAIEQRKDNKRQAR